MQAWDAHGSLRDANGDEKDRTGRRLVLVSAPAGYGKTAPVSQGLRAADTAHAWLSLDEYDNDLATFLDLLVAAVRTAPEAAVEPIHLLLRSPTLPSPNRLADALLEAMSGVRGPVVLAVDDDRVIDAPLALERMLGRQELAGVRAGHRAIWIGNRAPACFARLPGLLSPPDSTRRRLCGQDATVRRVDGGGRRWRR